MGPVERAIRARFKAPVTLHTLSRGKPFVVDRLNDKGLVLLLGEQENYTPLNWDCLEGLVALLRGKTGWVSAGGAYVTDGEPGTLDEYLKNCIARQTSRWVAVVLGEAGVLRIDPGPPLRVRLTEPFR